MKKQRCSVVTLTNLLWVIRTCPEWAHTGFITLHNYLNRGCYFFTSVLLVCKWNDTVTRATGYLFHSEALLKHPQINSYTLWSPLCHDATRHYCIMFPSQRETCTGKMRRIISCIFTFVCMVANVSDEGLGVWTLLSRWECVHMCH